VAVTSLEVPFRADLGRWSRWQWRVPWRALPVAIALLLLGVLAGAAARIDYAATYQPLTFEGGGMFGPVSGLRPVNDGFETTRWLVTAKPGQSATFSYTLTNSGSDAVEIYDVPQASTDWIYMSYAWAPALDTTGPPHKLPVVIPAHKSIQLLFSIRQPPCRADSARTEIGALVVRYRAFGFSHTIVSPMTGHGLEPVDVCWDHR
jgi:hypothetical protein